MSKITKVLTISEQAMINEQILTRFTSNLDRIFFFDIETTGFSAKTSICYLIGGIYHNREGWNYIQWFADQPSDESDILQQFMSFLSDYDTLIHFNGDMFDIPFLAERCKRLELPLFTEIVDRLHSVDLFRIARSYKKILQLENYKQKTIEHFLLIDREDQFNGGELIEYYKQYVKDQDPEKQRLLLLHNHDDICGMPMLLPILNYQALIDGDIVSVEYQYNQAKDYEGNPIKEVFLTLTLPIDIPVPLSFAKGNYTYRIRGNKILIRIPIYQGTIRHFYSNYKDYYYLPDEDEAMHKSISSFVDKSRRKQATAATCYTKLGGEFLPQENCIYSPIFQFENTDKSTWFQIKEDTLSDNAQLMKYAKDILSFGVN